MMHTSAGPLRMRRTWPQRLIIALGVCTSVALFGSAAALAAGWNKFNSIQRVAVALDRPDRSSPVNFLFVGSDSREAVAAGDADAGAFLEGETSGKRSDTLMIVRVDQRAGRIDILSIPRDLYVPIAGTGELDRVNAAYGYGEQTLVDTVSDYLRIPIHHYVEVDFRGFKGLVDTLGGIPLYFDHAMRDEYSGLLVDEPGCVRLDGTQALAFARARHLEVWTDGGWETDPTADLGRISRQQLFLRRAMDRSASLGLTDVGKVNRLVGVATENVTFDKGLSITQAVSLVRKFASFGGDAMATHSLPTEPFETSGGAQVLRLLEGEAAPTLQRFQGLEPPSGVGGDGAAPPPALTPAAISVTVLNGTGISGQAGEAAAGLAAHGFPIALVGDASGAGEAHTTLRHAAGNQQAAELIAATLVRRPQLAVDPAAGRGVVLITGGDFSGVIAPVAPAAPPPASGSVGQAGAPTATTEPAVGFVPTDAPPGTVCK